MSPTLTLTSAFKLIGLLTSIYSVAKVSSFIAIYLRGSRLHRYAHLSKEGQAPWALVTGASDGIGREFGEALAESGFNVILHGRNPTKLSRVESELQKKFPGRSFKTLVADASAVHCSNCASDASSGVDFKAIQQQLSGLHLTVLINNAGGGLQNPIFTPMHTETEERIIGNISLNALFPMLLTNALLPVLIQNSPSLVMNISSIADIGFPLVATYASSKGFIMTLTKSLGTEMTMEGHDVEILGIRVGKTTGAAGFKSKPRLFFPSAGTMARAALDRAGYGSRIVEGFWQHALQAAALSLLPGWMQKKVSMKAIGRERAAEMAAAKEL